MSFDVLCASLEVFFPSAFAVSGACLSQVFRAWHSPLLRFLIASAVFAPCGLSSLFHLVTLLGFSFRAFSCKRLVASSCAILSRLEAPSALYRWLLHAHDFVLAAFIAFESQRCSSILGASTLLQLVHIGSVVNRLRWSMLSWFSLLFRGSFLCLRSSCDDLHRCNTSVTAPTLTVYNKLAFSSAFALVFCSLLLVGSTVRLLAPLFLCAPDAAYPCRQPSPFTYKLSALAFIDERLLLVSASCVASLRTYRLS